MYVVTAGHHVVLGFGPSPEDALADASKAISKLPAHDNRPREVHPCSLDLYRLLQVERELYTYINVVPFRIEDGVAVPYFGVTAAAIDDYLERLRRGAEQADDPRACKFVVVLGGDGVYGFGPTPEWADVDATRRTFHCDFPSWMEGGVYPCSPRLYERLKAQPAGHLPVLRCRLVDGVAVSLRGPRLTGTVGRQNEPAHSERDEHEQSAAESGMSRRSSDSKPESRKRGAPLGRRSTKLRNRQS